jgi:hypothetical protein
MPLSPLHRPVALAPTQAADLSESSMTITRTARRHVISREEAVLLLRRRPPRIVDRGGHFPRGVIEEIFAQPGCAGLRFYFGTKPDGSLSMVFVGIDAHERDMTDGVLVEDFYPCPPFCDATSALIR